MTDFVTHVRAHISYAFFLHNRPFFLKSIEEKTSTFLAKSSLL